MNMNLWIYQYSCRKKKKCGYTECIACSCIQCTASGSKCTVLWVWYFCPLFEAITRAL